TEKARPSGASVQQPFEMAPVVVRGPYLAVPESGPDGQTSRRRHTVDLVETDQAGRPGIAHEAEERFVSSTHVDAVAVPVERNAWIAVGIDVEAVETDRIGS